MTPNLEVMMKHCVLFLATIFSVIGFSQRPKEHILKFKSWEYPKYYIPDTKIGIVSDESVPDRYKINFFTLKNLNFRSLQIVRPQEATYVLYIKPLRCVYEPEINKALLPNETSGKVVMNADFHCVIKKNDEVVFDFISNEKRTVLERKLPLQQNEFEKAIMEEVITHEKNFPKHYDDLYLKSVDNFIYFLKNDLDFVPKELPYVLYSFEDKELENITHSVIETISLFESGQLHRENLLQKILFWEDLATQYSLSDKKQKRIYWALMQNISASYFFLGDYPKALEYKEKARLTAYKNNYHYPAHNIQKILENRSSYQYIAPIKDFENMDFSQTQNFSNIEIINSNVLTEDFAQEEREDFEIKNKKVEVISKILYLDSSFEFLKRISKYAETFNKERYEDDKKRGEEKRLRSYYLSIDETYQNLINENLVKSEELKTFDVSVFSEEEKLLIADIAKAINSTYSGLKGTKLAEDSYNKTVDPTNLIDEYVKYLSELIILIDQKLVTYYEEINQQKNDKISLLYDKFFKYKGKDIKKIPYLNYLAYTLTHSQILNPKNNFELYEKYHKEYNKIYFDLFYSTDFNQIHHKDIDILLHPAVSPYYKLAMHKPNKENIPNFTYDENSIKKILLLLVE